MTTLSDDCYVRYQDKRSQIPFHYFRAFQAPAKCPDTGVCKQLRVGGDAISVENSLRPAFSHHDAPTEITAMNVGSPYYPGALVPEASSQWSQVRSQARVQDRSRLVLPTRTDFQECETVVEPRMGTLNTRWL